MANHFIRFHFTVSPFFHRLIAATLCLKPVTTTNVTIGRKASDLVNYKL